MKNEDVINIIKNTLKQFNMAIQNCLERNDYEEARMYDERAEGVRQVLLNLHINDVMDFKEYWGIINEVK